MIKNAQPLRFTPRGLVDAYDATDEFPGACQSLTNLIFDSANPELMAPRPGTTLIQNLIAGGLANPTFISCQITVGSRIYGMVSTSQFAPNIKDRPFCYDTATNQLVVITGIVVGNCPDSFPTTGDWTPPTMAAIGDYIIVTHTGAGIGGGTFFGAIRVSTMAWTTQTTATNALPSKPTAVANFRNRAYFICGNQLVYSDPLDPLTRTNASQSLTIGDQDGLTALAGLPVQTTSSGVVSALLAFKPTQVWQITGDTVTSDLAENFLSLTIGTKAPRSVAQSPLGVYFLHSAGPFIVDPLGSVRAVTNQMTQSDPDVQNAFINAQTPSRWAGAYNSSVYRACGPTIVNGLVVTQDYWFHEKRRRWTGPHSFAYDCASAAYNYFVLTSALNPGALVKSEPAPSLLSVYTDLGSPYNVTVGSATMPKRGDMFMNQVVESTIELGGQPDGATYTVTALDDQNNTLDSVTVTVPPLALPRWGGGSLWGGSGKVWSSGQPKPPKTYPVEWTTPLVFDKMQLLVAAVAATPLRVGTFYARVQKTGYQVQRT